ncbi:C45 family peptidase [Thermoflexus sp.]|uniref:C45 family peptidase n=1 Tax=Thermoflexus sp. TaxID=1969742 RepID=UPI002ADE3C17|nr:C45 family peptidase [Thermoflexus sp.]
MEPTRPVLSSKLWNTSPWGEGWHLPAPYRFLDLRGSHRQIGEALGLLGPPFRRPPWWPPPPDLAFAKACRQQVARWHPALLDEYEGYAAAQGLDPDFLWQQISRTFLRSRPFACSAVVWREPGGLWVGRNYDFRPVQQIRDLVRLWPRDGLASLGMMGSVPGGRYDGVNEAGLFVSLHAVMADTLPPRPGIPFHLIPRVLLERYRSAEEAVEALLRMPHILPMNVLVADPHRAYVVEVHPAVVAVRELEDGVLAVTNHYEHPMTRPFHGHRDLGSSVRRKERLERWVMMGSGSPRERLREALSDHEAPICGHRPGFTTLWSLIADLNHRRIEYALGFPCRAPFVMFPWPGG